MTSTDRRPSRLSRAVLAVALLGSAAPSLATAAGVEVEARPADRRVDVSVAGAPFTSYVWPERLAKPVLYPIRSARGALVTRGFPLDPRPGERVDHPHQVGLWFNHGDVNGVDFWNNSEARPPEERAAMGTIRHREVVAARSGTDRGELEVGMDWLLPGDRKVLDERTRFVFFGAPGVRGIDRLTTLTAVADRVVFKDNKEGLFGMRVARALEQPSDEPEVFTDASGRPTAVPVLDNTGVTGLYTSSEGLRGDAVWGTRARWVALSGRIGDEAVVLLMLDHPENPGYPAYWHARGYGLFAANPLGQRVFTEGKQSLDLALDRGSRALFRYRLLVLSGPFSAETAEAAWKQFVGEYGE
jgi:hypothetical protein